MIEINVHPGSSKFLKFLAAILLMIGIIKGCGSLFGDVEAGVDPQSNAPLASEVVNSGAVTSGGLNTQPAIYQNSGQSSGSVRPSMSEIILQPLAPTAGATTKNPVTFKWQSTPSIYYSVEIRHAESGKSYSSTSQWLNGDVYQINLPNDAIGNLEWRIHATNDPQNSRKVESNWQHFTFDPFYENKGRQNGE